MYRQIEQRDGEIRMRGVIDISSREAFYEQVINTFKKMQSNTRE
jgi:hypothetical protein